MAFIYTFHAPKQTGSWLFSPSLWEEAAPAPCRRLSDRAEWTRDGPPPLPPTAATHTASRRPQTAASQDAVISGVSTSGGGSVCTGCWGKCGQEKRPNSQQPGLKKSNPFSCSFSPLVLRSWPQRVQLSVRWHGVNYFPITEKVTFPQIQA